MQVGQFVRPEQLLDRPVDAFSQAESRFVGSKDPTARHLSPRDQVFEYVQLLAVDQRALLGHAVEPLERSEDVLQVDVAARNLGFVFFEQVEHAVVYVSQVMPFQTPRVVVLRCAFVQRLELALEQQLVVEGVEAAHESTRGSFLKRRNVSVDVFEIPQRFGAFEDDEDLNDIHARVVARFDVVDQRVSQTLRRVELVFVRLVFRLRAGPVVEVLPDAVVEQTHLFVGRAGLDACPERSVLLHVLEAEDVEEEYAVSEATLRSVRSKDVDEAAEPVELEGEAHHEALQDEEEDRLLVHGDLELEHEDDHQQKRAGLAPDIVPVHGWLPVQPSHHHQTDPEKKPSDRYRVEGQSEAPG